MTGQVAVRTYRATRPEKANAQYQADAARMALAGYYPVSQSWADGRSGCLRVVLLGFIGALIWKPKGTLSVTYQGGKA